MWTAEEFNKIYKKLRNGESVKCQLDDGGILKAVGDYKITHCFICDVCKEKLNID